MPYKYGKRMREFLGAFSFPFQSSFLIKTIMPSKTKIHVSRPDFYKKESRRAVFFVIYYFLLHAFFTHYYLPPGALRSNISKTNIRY